MKKFLFTLASLIAFGFAANASIPQLALNTSEITLGAGEAQEVHIQLMAGLDDIMRGCQIQFVMYNPAGERIADAVILQKKYARNTQWFGAETISKSNEEGNEGNAVGTSNPFPAKYRALLSNASSNEFWFPESQYEEWEIPHTYPINVLAFTVKVNVENWADEYAILKLEANPKSMEDQGEDEYPLKASMVNGSFLWEDGAMQLKINNADYQAPGGPTALEGTVTIGEADGYVVPITVDVNGTYTLEVTVAKDGGDPVVVPVDENGNITLGATPEYGTYVINATATGTGDYEGTVVATPKTITIDQLKLDDPVITFDTADDGTVTINITGATRYEVKVDGEPYDGLTVAPIYDATQSVEVEAWNEAEMYIAGHATNSTTVAQKPYAPAVNPVITFNEGDNGLTITVDPYTSYEVIVDGVNMGQINYVDKTWEAQVVVVNAVNEPQYQEKGEASDTYNLPALANMNLTGTLTIGAVDQETGKIYVSYEGEEDVTIAVTIEAVREVQNIDGKAGYVQLPNPGKYNVTAVATAVEPHYNTLTEGPVERIWDEPETTTPAPGITAGVNEETHSFDIVATGANADDAVTLYVTWYDGEGTAHNEVIPGTGSASFSLPQTEDVQYVSYWASALNPADDNAGVNNGAQYVEVPAYVPTPENKDFQGTVTVSVDDQGNVTAVYNPAEGEDVTPTIVCDPNKLTEYGENIPVAVTVSAPGYNDKTYNETVDYTAPELPKTAQPGYNVATVVGQQGTFVTLSKAEGEDECEILYRYMIDNGEWSAWMTYSDMLTFNTAGYYTMEAKAKADNKEWSDPVSFNFTVNPKPTSIEEIMSAENVANVRFFNVAGQEMQEINGMTIVVVTYTNGQTVSTKVLK